MSKTYLPTNKCPEKHLSFSLCDDQRGRPKGYRRGLWKTAVDLISEDMDHNVSKTIILEMVLRHFNKTYRKSKRNKRIN